MNKSVHKAIKVPFNTIFKNETSNDGSAVLQDEVELITVLQFTHPVYQQRIYSILGLDSYVTCDPSY